MASSFFALLDDIATLLDDVSILTKVAGLLPTHTRRSEEMERFQQFSTPLPMGLAALAAAQITPRDLVLADPCRMFASYITTTSWSNCLLTLVANSAGSRS